MESRSALHASEREWRKHRLFARCACPRASVRSAAARHELKIVFDPSMEEHTHFAGRGAGQPWRTRTLHRDTRRTPWSFSIVRTDCFLPETPFTPDRFTSSFRTPTLPPTSDPSPDSLRLNLKIIVLLTAHNVPVATPFYLTHLDHPPHHI